MEILYKKEKEEADLLLEQQRLVGIHPESSLGKGQLALTPSLPHRWALAHMAYPSLIDSTPFSLTPLMESELTAPGSLSLKNCS